MSTPLTVLVVVAAWLLAVALWRWTVVRWLSRGPGGDSATGFLWRLVRGYSRVMHRPTYEGLEFVPSSSDPGGLVVVSNHTGPVDPLLVQAVCRFEVRWMMASDMMVPQLDWLWRRMIPVARDGRDSGPVREAIRHVRAGGVVGIFPEGGIARPREELRPFHSGAGLIITRTKVPVLLVWVSETPPHADMGRSMITRSRARVVFVGRFEFPDKSDPTAVTDQLRRRLAEVSGWPVNDEPLSWPAANPDPFAA